MFKSIGGLLRKLANIFSPLPAPEPAEPSVPLSFVLNLFLGAGLDPAQVLDNLKGTLAAKQEAARQGIKNVDRLAQLERKVADLKKVESAHVAANQTIAASVNETIVTIEQMGTNGTFAEPAETVDVMAELALFQSQSQTQS
jgi:hypothetical protein